MQILGRTRDVQWPRNAQKITNLKCVAIHLGVQIFHTWAALSSGFCLSQWGNLRFGMTENRALIFCKLRNLYWFLRNCRTWDGACRRKRYRQIRLEKIRLLAAGVSQIELHLQCRVSTNPHNSNYQQRLASYYAQGSLLDGWPGQTI